MVYLILWMTALYKAGPITLLVDQVLRGRLVVEGYGVLISVAFGGLFAVLQIISPWMGKLELRTMERAAWITAFFMLGSDIYALINHNMVVWFIGAGYMLPIFYRVFKRLQDRLKDSYHGEGKSLNWLLGQEDRVAGYTTLICTGITQVGDWLKIDIWYMACVPDMIELPICLLLIRWAVDKLDE